MATTPPMRTAIHTPSTPLHGARYDSYQPYQTRKSTRHLTQQNQCTAQTPPPLSSDSESRFLSAPISKSASTGHQAPDTYSPPSSTHTSPQKKQFENRKPKKPKNSSGVKDSILSTGSEQLDPFEGLKNSLPLDPPTINIGANMLPTPAKTPRKKSIPASAIVPTARVLFSVQSENTEEAIPTPRKRGRKRRRVGFLLDSSIEDDETNSEDKIQIFTDSKEKVPELDLSEENPFYDNPDHAKLHKEPPKIKSVKRRKAKLNTNDNKEVEEAFKREEGMVYVFRGKKIYLKFADNSDPEMQSSSTLAVDNAEVDAEPSTRLCPLTRSSIKPRLLFPTNPQRHEHFCGNKEDEEAVTDIEELDSVPNESEMTDLAHDTEEEALVTPVMTSFTTPVTPPMTGYATRAVTKKTLGSSSPVGPEPVESQLGEKPRSFHGWQRTRDAKKRGSEVLENEIGRNKRVKENIP